MVPESWCSRKDVYFVCFVDQSRCGYVVVFSSYRRSLQIISRFFTYRVEEVCKYWSRWTKISFNVQVPELEPFVQRRVAGLDLISGWFDRVWCMSDSTKLPCTVQTAEVLRVPSMLELDILGWYPRLERLYRTSSRCGKHQGKSDSK